MRPRYLGNVGRRSASAILSLVALLAGPAAARAQVDLCVEAERFVRDAMGMQALAEPDTIDDWRTQARVAGCRVTAAGAAAGTSREVARGFFQALEASEWTRTPDPRDAPNEASLRYRRLGADCLFSYYDRMSALGTEAEFTVSDAVELAPGQQLFHVLILCVPAAPAAYIPSSAVGPKMPGRGMSLRRR